MSTNTLGTLKIHSYPVFYNISWAIAYTLFVQFDSKIYRTIPEDEMLYLFEFCCAEDGSLLSPETCFPIDEEKIIDGIKYVRILVEDQKFWTTRK
jgi:hypothetical protein